MSRAMWILSAVGIVASLALVVLSFIVSRPKFVREFRQALRDAGMICPTCGTVLDEPLDAPSSKPGGRRNGGGR